MYENKKRNKPLCGNVHRRRDLPLWRYYPFAGTHNVSGVVPLAWRVSNGILQLLQRCVLCVDVCLAAL